MINGHASDAGKDDQPVVADPDDIEACRACDSVVLTNQQMSSVGSINGLVVAVSENSPVNWSRFPVQACTAGRARLSVMGVLDLMRLAHG